MLSPDDSQLCKLYNRASGFIFPSLYEGFGIPLLEAMNCGCPIIASHIPSTIEVARDVPIYFEPSDTENLIFALDQVIEEGKHTIGICLFLLVLLEGIDILRGETINRTCGIQKRLQLVVFEPV